MRKGARENEPFFCERGKLGIWDLEVGIFV
jgi:hypothetical protein